MLKKRIITASCISILFLLSLVALPSEGFAGFVVAVILLAAWEWGKLSGFANKKARIAYSFFCVVLLFFVSYFSVSAYQKTTEIQIFLSLFLIAGAWWAVALLWIQGYPSSALLWGNRWVRLLIGLLVLVPSGLALVFLHYQPEGVWLILLLVAVVATADIGAYFAGRSFGRRKLAKEVSPGKSWEGVWGGLLANTLLAFLLASFSDLIPFVTLLAIVLPTAMVSVLGDLLESMLKRHCGIKDSGTILPGHGGVLDRIDGLTAAAPVFALAIILSGLQLPH